MRLATLKVWESFCLGKRGKHSQTLNQGVTLFGQERQTFSNSQSGSHSVWVREANILKLSIRESFCLGQRGKHSQTLNQGVILFGSERQTFSNSQSGSHSVWARETNSLKLSKPEFVIFHFQESANTSKSTGAGKMPHEHIKRPE